MATDLGELLVPYMPTIRVPRTGDRVYKSECVFSFDSPVSVCLLTAGHERRCWRGGSVRGAGLADSLLLAWFNNTRESAEMCVCVCL